MRSNLTTFKIASVITLGFLAMQAGASEPLPPGFKPAPEVAVIGPSIEKSSVGTVTKTGLKLELSNVANLTVPGSTLPAGTKVTLAAKSDSYGASDFDPIAMYSDVSRRMRHYITINTGTVLVKGKFSLQLTLTPEFRSALGASERTLAFGIFNDGDTEMYEPITTTVSADGKSITMTLDNGRFIKTGDGSEESTIVVAAVPREDTPKK